MKELHILIVDKKTGMPVYMKSSVSQDDSKAYLYSGLMTVINQVISEFDKSSSKKIVTNQHTIFARETENYYLFILGEGSKERLAMNLLEYIRFFLQSFPSDEVELPEMAGTYLDKISEDFFKIYSREDLIPVIFTYSKTEGLKELTFQADQNLTTWVSSYLSKLDRIKNQIIYAPITEKNQIVLITKPDGETTQIMVFLFKEFRFIDFHTYRHKLKIFANEHLERFGDYWINGKKDILESEELLNNLAEKIQKSMEGDSYGNVEITDLGLFLETIKPVLPSILTGLIEGKPFGIHGLDELVNQILFFLSSITGIYDISNEFQIDAPSRIMVLTDQMEFDLALDLGYYLLDMDTLTLNPKIKPNRYIMRSVEEIYENKTTPNEVMQSLSNFVHNIWDTVEDILQKVNLGADLNSVINASDIDQGILKRLLEQTNPTLFGKQSSHEEKVIHW